STEAGPSTRRSQNKDQVGVLDRENQQAWHSVEINFDALTAHDPLIGSCGFDPKFTRLQSSRDTIGAQHVLYASRTGQIHRIPRSSGRVSWKERLPGPLPSCPEPAEPGSTLEPRRPMGPGVWTRHVE